MFIMNEWLYANNIILKKAKYFLLPSLFLTHNTQKENNKSMFCNILMSFTFVRFDSVC